MIPKYEKIMLPFLKFIADGKEHGLSETHDALAVEFKLSDNELRELLPSGRQPVFRNRVGWARTYLKKAGLVTSPKRAHFKISQAGIDLLKEKPSEITSFPNSVYDFVGQVEYKIILIDGERLANLMIEHNVGLSTVNTYHVKTIDSDYFEGN